LIGFVKILKILTGVEAVVSISGRIYEGVRKMIKGQSCICDVTGQVVDTVYTVRTDDGVMQIGEPTFKALEADGQIETRHNKAEKKTTYSLKKKVEKKA
jgi:hypothetical protein